MNPGLFITFEGCEGSGKSTLILALSKWLAGLEIRHTVSRQPGGTKLGQQVRELLLKQQVYTVVPMAELFLFCADRAQHVEGIIKPALQAGEIVLCDRYTDSTEAYQGYGRGQDLTQLQQLNHLATGGLKPDRTYLLDVDPKIGLTRRMLAGENNRFEAEDLAFHEAVREGYLQLSVKDLKRFCVVDANQTLNEVFAYVIQDLSTLLLEHKRKKL